MGKVVPLPKVKRADVFSSEINDRARFSSMVILTDHIIEQMAERGISSRQVVTVLRKGQAPSDAPYSERHGTYEGKIIYAGGGREITVVCALTDRTLHVYGITVY